MPSVSTPPASPTKDTAPPSSSLPAEEVASEVVTEIIDDVLTSTTLEPSIASVVFDTFKDFVCPEDANEMPQSPKEATAAVDSGEKGVTFDDSVADGSVGDKVKSFEANISDRETTPPTPTKEDKTITFSGKKVPESGQVIVANGFTRQASSEELGTPTSTTKDRVAPLPPKAASPERTENKNISGQIHISGTAVKIEEEGKGHSSIIQISSKPQPDTPTPKQSSPQPASPQMDLSVTEPTSVPQTDLDTFETRMSHQVSNLDDDLSDKRSDSGSVNTVDSVGEKEEPVIREPRAPIERRIRPRDVSCISLLFKLKFILSADMNLNISSILLVCN